MIHTENAVIRLVTILLLVVVSGACRQQQSPNILFIAVDDLRPQFGAYGKTFIYSPGLDRLAMDGFVFSRAYANVPVCGASRASLLTGIRPTRTRFVDYLARADEDAPGIVTLPQHFRENGYFTASLGKVFHHLDDSPASWSEAPWHPNADPLTRNASWRDYLLPANIVADTSGSRRGPPYEMADVPDSAYYDGKIALRAIRMIRRLNNEDAPFFLAVGFLKPHLPFNAPKRYWDLYPEETIHLTDTPLFPVDAPQEAWHNWGELRNYAYVPPAPDPLPDTLALKLIHGYYAGVSYIDAQVGLLLDELDHLDLADNTIVVLWGDHGWSLGEHGLWCKHSSFNVAVQVPLLLHVPGKKGGLHIPDLVEFVDLYPSLVDLAGLPLQGHLQGQSFVPSLDGSGESGKTAVFPRWHGAESIRTSRFLYTEWLNEDGTTRARMLYDHETDPHETVNQAERPEYEATVADLHERLFDLIRSR